MEEIQKLLQEQGEAFQAYKAANDEVIAQIQAQGTANAGALEKVDTINAAIEDVGARLKDAETQLNKPSRQAANDEQPMSEEQKEHLDAFINFARNAKDSDAESRFQKASKAAEAKMEIATTAPSSGGYAVPEVIDRRLSEILVDISPMRDLVTVRTASSPDYKELVNLHGGAYEWLGEGDTRNEQNTPTFAEVAPTFGMIQSYYFANEETFDDMFVDVQSLLIDEASIAHSVGEGVAVISGNGTKKPTGFLNGTPVVTDDKSGRAFGTLQFLPTGAAADFAASNPSDVLYDTIYSLKAGYRKNATWVTNKATLATVRKFKDSEGNYLWQPNLVAGQPQMLAGYPIVEAEDMPDIAANAFPMAFGDFKAGYFLVDLVGTRMTIDPYTTPGKIKFYIRRRLGGNIRKDEAIKVIKCSV